MGSEFDQYAASYKEIIDRDAAFAGGTLEHFIRVRLTLLEAELRRDGVPAPRRILDFGCGIGATEVALKERFPDATLDGIDPSGESIEVARRLGLRDTTFHVGRETQLPFATDTFDLIYSNGTFHHIDHAEHPAIFRELARVLRPGGQLFVFENNPLNPVVVRVMRRNPFDKGAHTLVPWYLRRLEREAGLDVRKTRFYVFIPEKLRVLRPLERFLGRVPMGAQYYVWARKRG